MPRFAVTLRVEYRDVLEARVWVEAADAKGACAEALRIEEAGAELDWQCVETVESSDSATIVDVKQLDEGTAPI
ncbi:hypothetical protein JMJ56_23135 [Belnapia sp. T18]|uniref:Uncharacterized protein n=1 Tax=Belnapia arida TaxID=2804533 RepID=A0ABS1U8A7_9PROT|nr:hypothetical protein [Belnapia arida]MBL6080912.1 hypothetical protein [Belnapia arida]